MINERDRMVAAAAEREAEAQLVIVRALGKLDGNGRERVLRAVRFILAADELVPGVCERFAGGGKREA